MMQVLLALAGLMGAAGVVLMAVGSHGKPGLGLDNAGTLLLIHAAALLGGVAALHAGLLTRGIALAGLAALVLGATLFAGDLTLRAYLGQRLFPMAAPTGGMVLIVGWLLIAAAAVAAVLRPLPPGGPAG